MKKLLLSVCVVLSALFAAPASAAIVLSLVPVSGSVENGQTVLMDLKIAGLGDGTAPSLGAFDVDVSFDTALLSYSSVTFGDPVLGDQLDVLGLGAISADTPGAGSVNLFELSLDSIADLNLLQAPAFTLARLSFASLNIGTALFGLTINGLPDAEGNALRDVTTAISSVAIVSPPNQAPEPGSILLLGLGIAAFAVARRRTFCS